MGAGTSDFVTGMSFRGCPLTGPVKQILGLVIDYDQEARILGLYQTHYIEESLEQYGITDR